MVRDRERPRKTIGEAVKKGLDANSLSIDMIHNRTLWHYLIHAADPTKQEKACLLVIVLINDGKMSGSHMYMNSTITPKRRKCRIQKGNMKKHINSYEILISCLSPKTDHKIPKCQNPHFHFTPSIRYITTSKSAPPTPRPHSHCHLPQQPLPLLVFHMSLFSPFLNIPSPYLKAMA